MGRLVRLCTRHRADGGGTRERMPPMSIVDTRRSIPGSRAALCALILWARPAVELGSSDMDAYREKRGRWQQAIVATSLRFIRASKTPWWRRRSIPRCRCGNISMRPTAGLRVRADTATLDLAASRCARRARRCPGSSGVSLCGFRRHIAAWSNRRRCADMISARGLKFYLTRFLDANRRPSRSSRGQASLWKTLQGFSWY